MTAERFDAWLFDGRSAQGRRVHVSLDGDFLLLSSDGQVLRRVPLRRARLSEPFRHAPRLVRLSDGATLQVSDAARFTTALGAAGMPPAVVARLQQWWPTAVCSVFALVALLVLAYVHGLPLAARWAAFAMPRAIEQRIGAEVLRVLDARLGPSRFDVETQRAIASRFAKTSARAAPRVKYQLEFRSAKGEEGINAMALPGSIIVLLDGLVTFAADDDAVLGALGHELGHVAHKHSMRQLIQGVGIGVLAALVWGDFSHVAANVPVVLGVLRYSREFEREADDFAIAFLRANGLTPRPLYEFFSRVRRLESKSGASGVPGFLSSHPPTPERLERLRREVEVAEAPQGEPAAARSGKRNDLP